MKVRSVVALGREGSTIWSEVGKSTGPSPFCMSALLEIILKCPFSARIFMSVCVFLVLTLLYINTLLNIH